MRVSIRVVLIANAWMIFGKATMKQGSGVIAYPLTWNHHTTIPTGLGFGVILTVFAAIATGPNTGASKFLNCQGLRGHTRSYKQCFFKCQKNVAAAG